MVWTTERAARELSKHHSLNALEIEITLRWIGFLDTAPNLDRVLEYAEILSDRFKVLQEALAQWKDSVEHLLRAGEFANSLRLTSYKAEESAHSSNNPLSALCGDRAFDCLEEQHSLLQADAHAIYWLAFCLSASYAIRIYEPLLDSGRICILSHTGPENSSKQELDKGLCAIGLDRWLNVLGEVSNAEKIRLYESVPSACFSLIHTIKEISSSTPSGRLFLPSSPKATPRTPLVDERDLTTAHWYFPRTTELLDLRTATRWIEGRRKTAPNYFERLVLAIALITGHTILEVLNIRLVGAKQTIRKTKDEQIVLRLVPGYAGLKHFVAEWRIPLGSNCLTIPLPEFLDKALRSVMDLNTNARLIDRLPLTTVDWKTRCENCLVSILRCSPTRAKLILRDTMVRTCYDLSKNRAIAYWLIAGVLGDTKRLRANQIALSHYLNPAGTRTREIVQQAWKTIFGKYGATERLLRYGLADSIPDIPQHAVSAYMQKRLACTGKSNPVVVHNAFAEYCLLFLIISTGHRKSTTPFFFPWDIITSAKLSFIADKCIVGNEARFVPLADNAVSQFETYLLHLKALYAQLTPASPVKKHISEILRLSSTSSHSQYEPSHGLFFRILSDDRIETITTGSLDRILASCSEDARIGRFRSTIAEYLWSRSLSGIEVSTFLGHANDFHPFGSASHWSVKSWADKCRPLIDDYLGKHGWQVIPSPLLRTNSALAVPMPALPRLVPGGQSYEGRTQQRITASQRALQVLRAILTDEFLENQDYVIDDEVISNIRDSAMVLLAADKDAQDALSRILADQLVKLRRRGIRIKSIFPNIYKSTSSPVSITFARQFANANVFREQWLRHIGVPIGGTFDTLERSAHLTISLIVLEGQLDSKVIAGTITNLVTGDGLSISIYDSTMVLRTAVETETHEYEVSIILGEACSALALGLLGMIQRQRTSSNPPSVKQIDERIDAICRRIVGRYPGKGIWGIDHLIEIFRPWWFIHQPGFLHSIARGIHHGPAPHPISEASLLAPSEPPPLPRLTGKVSLPTDEQATTLATEHATREIQSLLRKASGRTESGTAHTQLQRKRLRENLREIASPELAQWVDQKQIIDHLLSFTRDLLETGGFRKKNLAFNSIKTYLLSILGSLIRLAWDFDFSEMTSENYRTLYKAVEEEQQKKRTDWHLVLRMFHQHLRNKIGAPFLKEYALPKSGLKKRCRSSLITAQAIDLALSDLSKNTALTKEQLEAAKLLLVLGFGYALRQKEGIGLTTRNFDANQEDYLSINANVIRDLKSASSRRNIPCGMLSQQHTRVIRAQLQKAQLAPGTEKYLFGVSDRVDEILRPQPIVQAVINALRTSSGNVEAVFHDLRRTTATRIVMAGSPLKSNCPVLHCAKERLVGDEKFDESFSYSMTGSGQGNPYFIDSVARILGHECEDSLLNTYFHGSSILLADLAMATNSETRLDDMRMAAMLNKERTSIVKLRQRLSQQRLPTNTSDLIRYYIRKDSPNSRTAQAASHTLDAEEIRLSDDSNYLVLFDRLLCARKREASSLSEMLERCSDLDIPEKISRHFLENYRKLVTEIGFDDFEPDSSELIYRKPAHGRGVLRGQKEREIALQRISTNIQRRADFSSDLKQMCEMWFVLLDSKFPRLICNETGQLNKTLDTLSALGVDARQIKAEAVGNLTSTLVQIALRRFPEMISRSSGRLSRGPKSVRVTEVALSIQQEANSVLPDGRDFHRLLAVLFCLPSITATDTKTLEMS